LYRIVILSLLLILSGCGYRSGRHNELPAIPDKGMAGKIVVVRISSIFGLLLGWQIAVDGKGLLGIGSGEYAEFLLPEGEHYITLRCSQSTIDYGIPHTLYFEDTLKFIAKASQPIYFIASPSWKCGKIRRSNEIEAQKHIKRSKFIKLENKVSQ